MKHYTHNCMLAHPGEGGALREDPGQFELENVIMKHYTDNCMLLCTS